MNRFGLHTSIAGGLYKALDRGKALGCDCIQIFSHNPRGWKITPITNEDAELFKNTREETGIGPVAAHASYLLNIASPDIALKDKSINMLRQEMLRANTIGAEFVVLHTGTAHDGEGIKRAAGSIKAALEDLETNTELLLENTSGKKGDTTSSIESIAELLNLTSDFTGGVCIDSCHAFAAGYDLRTDEGAGVLSDEVTRLLGSEMVKFLHLNDSKGEHASGTDRHEHIGKGNIGNIGLERFLSIDAFRNLPSALETPRTNDEDDLMNLKAARKLHII